MGQHPFQNFIVRFRRGDAVFDEGEKGRTMFIVQSGLVGLYQDVEGERQLLGKLEKGDFFGEMSILEGLPRTASAVAEEEVELIEINHAVFDKMIRGNIEIAVRMMRKLSIRLREAEARIGELKAGGAKAARRSRPRGELPRHAASGTISGVRLVAEDQDVAYALNESETLVGRFDPVTQLKPDIDLTDLDLKRTVSRQHARIVKTPDGFALVEEVGALNGTFVNEIKLTPGQLHRLADGDRLTFGDVSATFRT